MIIDKISSSVTSSHVNRAYNLAVFHHRGAIAKSSSLVYVMLDQENAKPLLFQLFDKLGYHFGFLWAQRSCRLVHDQDFGVEIDCPRNRYRLALPTR